MKKIVCIFISVIMTAALWQFPVSAAKLSISRTAVRVPVDYYSTLTVKGAKGTVKWSSDNKKVVSVKKVTDNSADIIGIGEGTAYVSATADGKTLKCKVTVRKAFVDISGKSAELLTGETADIKLAVTGQRSLRVSVSDESVCSASRGKWKNGKTSLTIKAESAGKAKVKIFLEGEEEKVLKTVTVNVKDTDGTDVENAEKTEGKEVSVISYVKPVSKRASDVYKRLRADMKSIIEDYPFDCGVYLYNTEKGSVYSYNRKIAYPGASTIKLPYVYYCCTQIEQGKHSLDEKYTFQEKHRTGGQGIIQNTEYGSQWTIKELITLTLEISDNVAYYMLIDIFGKEGFNAMVKSWGYSEQIGGYNYPNLSPEFLCEAMMKFHKKAFSSKNNIYRDFWSVLEGDTRSMVRGAANKSKTAVKYGETLGFYNEVCYIDSDSPYVLVIMSKTNNNNEKINGDRELFRAIARCADRINKAYVELKS